MRQKEKSINLGGRKLFSVISQTGDILTPRRTPDIQRAGCCPKIAVSDLGYLNSLTKVVSPLYIKHVTGFAMKARNSAKFGTYDRVV